MISRELSLLVTLLIIIIGAITSYVSVQIYHKDDAPLEQFAEEVIKDTTGLSIDFTVGDNNEDEPC